MPYIGKTTDGFGVRNRFVYLASASDTSVSGADANGATLTFTDGAYVDVYLNGVLLKSGTDYNTNTANTIAGLSALAANDEVTVIVYDVFTVADMVSATSGGTFSGAVTFNGAFTSLGIDDNADATAITIDSSERVLIGTTTAETLAPTTTPKVQIEGTDHHTSSLSIVRNSNDNGQSLLILGKSRGTSVGADTVVQDDDNVGEVLFTAADGSDRTPQVASVRAAVDGTPGSNDMPGRLEFYTTADGSQTITKRMTINSSGLVSIQNDSDTDFDISSVATNTVLNLKNNTSGASNCVSMSFSAESNNEQYITAVTNSTNNNGALAFSRREGGSRIETMRLASNGSMIIGATDQGTDNSAYFENSGILVIRRASGTNQTNISFVNGSSLAGTITTSSGSTAYNTSSDYRLKENVTYDWDATSRLKQLKPARFNFKVDKDTTLDGFLAHEVSDIVPNAINGEKDAVYTAKDEVNGLGKEGEPNMQSIDHSKLVPLLVKTIQELEARITTLEGG